MTDIDGAGIVTVSHESVITFALLGREKTDLHDEGVALYQNPGMEAPGWELLLMTDLSEGSTFFFLRKKYFRIMNAFFLSLLPVEREVSPIKGGSSRSGISGIVQ